MKSLSRRFQIFENKNPLYSSWTNFCLSIEKQNFSNQILKKWFSKLVPTDDLSDCSKNELLQHASHLNYS